MNDNISYKIDESDPTDFENNTEMDNHLKDLLKEFENINVNIKSEDDVFVEIKNYDMNYTLKQLLFICEYYNISKGIKLNKMKKQDIIEQIIIFENDISNFNIVTKRKQLWYFMDELKSDKFMKKYIIW
jgi:hypothetical protein